MIAYASSEIFEVAAAIVASIGAAGTLIFCLSSWLGKVWAARILASDKQKYEAEMEMMRAQFSLSLKEYEVKTSAILDDRKRVILGLSRELTEAQLTVWVFWHVTIEFRTDGDLIEARNEANDALKRLRNLLGESRLFLPSSLFSKLDNVTSKLGGLWGIAAYCARNTPAANNDAKIEMQKSMAREGATLTSLDREMDSIFEEFRSVLGTNRG